MDWAKIIFEIIRLVIELIRNGGLQKTRNVLKAECEKCKSDKENHEHH